MEKIPNSQGKSSILLGERLAVVRERLGLSQQEFASKLGVKVQKIRDIERNKTKIPLEFVPLLEGIFSTNIRYLLYGEEPIFLRYHVLNSDEYLFVPLVEGSVQAGVNGRLIYDSPADFFPFKRYWIEKKFGKSPERHKQLLLVRVSGDSMIPTINPNEIILVDSFESERIEIKSGKIYLVRHPDGYISVKRVVLMEKHHQPRIVCLSDNPTYEPFEFDIEPGKTLKWYILGRVRWIGREVD